ncbi:MAG: polysaccharide deacetylase family protein [Thermodesulfobacteriota bacterium]|nr:polysaccharide deacetylase family protein [Thermodesulfobacteriota bacterium]
MICLTGDVHHSSLKTDDYRCCKATELDAAIAMAHLCDKYGIQVTLFFSGLCAKESPDLLKRTARMDNVEIGGHNYFAFKPKTLFRLYRRWSGLKNGPYWYQFWEIRHTVRALERVCKRPVQSWRDHGYRHDQNTREILRKSNIRYLSDTLSANFAQPAWNGGVIDVPINTLPDHDYVYHGLRQPGTFDESVLLRSPFRTRAMSKEQWLERVKGEVERIEGKGGLATILAHPACMEVFDNFKTFTKLCSFLANSESCKMADIEDRLKLGA